MLYKVDLHTHSYGSPDGGLRLKDYRQMLERRGLDFVAVTDHDSVDAALELQRELGDKIIVGEEISTRDGELIGLYLKEKILPGLSVAETVKAIHRQHGLVYVPHPFETVRKGLPETAMGQIAGDVDIVEVHNGRAVFQNRSARALAWAAKYRLPGTASSDAHGGHGWGKTYSLVGEKPSRDNLTRLLSQAKYSVGSPGLRGVLYPKVSRLREKFRV